MLVCFCERVAIMGGTYSEECKSPIRLGISTFENDPVKIFEQNVQGAEETRLGLHSGAFVLSHQAPISLRMHRLQAQQGDVSPDAACFPPINTHPASSGAHPPSKSEPLPQTKFTSGIWCDLEPNRGGRRRCRSGPTEGPCSRWGRI